MDADEDELKLNKIETVELETMSIKALVGYIDDLRSEIKRVENQIRFKKEARRGAENFFQ